MGVLADLSPPVTREADSILLTWTLRHPTMDMVALTAMTNGHDLGPRLPFESEPVSYR